MRVLALLAIAALAGCASMTQSATDKIVGSWIGAPVTDVFQNWGLPARTFKSAAMTLYEWDGNQTTMYMQSKICVRQLRVDEAGVVQSGLQRGNNCCVSVVSGYCATLVRKPS